MAGEHLPEAEIAVSVGDAKFVALLVEGHPGDLGEGARRTGRADRQLVVELPQDDATVLPARQIWEGGREEHWSEHFRRLLEIKN